MLLFFFAVGWSNSALAQFKLWCASGGGDWNCVTPIFGPWTFIPILFGPFDGLKPAPTADAAYSELSAKAASFSATTGCPLTVGPLPEFTFLDSGSHELAKVQVSWNDGQACINAGLNTVSGQKTATVEGFRQFLGCPIGAVRAVDQRTWTDPSVVCVAPPTPQYVIKLSRLDGLAPESGTSLFSNEPGQPSPELVATVYDEHNQLVPNVLVQLQANAIPNTGGHHHGDNSVTLRTGTLASADPSANLSQNAQILSGNTGSTGLVFTYNAPPVGGDNTIAATCIDNHHCTQQGPMQVGVGIKDLQPLGDAVFQSAAPIRLTGQTTRHPNNHYGTAEWVQSTIVLATEFFSRKFATLGINDMSLAQGGLFDIQNQSDWLPPHILHRTGTSVDIDRTACLDLTVTGANCPTAEQLPVNFRLIRILCEQVGGHILKEPTIHCQLNGSRS